MSWPNYWKRTNLTYGWKSKDFSEPKNCLQTQQILIYPDANSPYFLFIDAFKYYYLRMEIKTFFWIQKMFANDPKS